MNAPKKWRDTTKVKPTELTDARLQTHFAIEWASRAGRFLAAPQADYSQIALRWDDQTDGLRGAPIQTERGELTVGVKFAPLEVNVAIAAEIQANIVLDGVAHAEVGDWLENELNQAGLEGARIRGELPYKLAHPRLSDGGAYETADLDRFATLQAWFANAADALNAERQNWLRFKPGPVLCWPHHFDLAALITFDTAVNPEAARSIGIGMSPGDENYAEPYFYINPWPRRDKGLPEPPPNSFWHTDRFFSLIMLASALPDDDGATLGKFLARGAQIASDIIQNGD